MIVQVKIRCPYCEFINKRSLDVFQYNSHRHFTTCDLEEGGCDKDFMVVLEMKVNVGTQKLDPEIDWSL